MTLVERLNAARGNADGDMRPRGVVTAGLLREAAARIEELERERTTYRATFDDLCAVLWDATAAMAPSARCSRPRTPTRTGTATERLEWSLHPRRSESPYGVAIDDPFVEGDRPGLGSLTRRHPGISEEK